MCWLGVLAVWYLCALMMWSSSVYWLNVMIKCGDIICLIGVMVNCSDVICLLVVGVMFLILCLCLSMWYELVMDLGVCRSTIMFNWLLGVCDLVMLWCWLLGIGRLTILFDICVNNHVGHIMTKLIGVGRSNTSGMTQTELL